MKMIACLTGCALSLLLITGCATGRMAVPVNPSPGSFYLYTQEAGFGYLVYLEVDFGGEKSKMHENVFPGKPFSFQGGRNGNSWHGDYLLTDNKDGTVLLKSIFTVNGKAMGTFTAGLPMKGQQRLVVEDEAGDSAKRLVIDEAVMFGVIEVSP